MKLPRDLSGAELVKILCRRWDYRRVHQVGSHVILETELPVHHRVAVPNHPVLRVGTLNGILRAVAAHKAVERDEILASGS
jgi:predicted RNA binding protein YcfA (HicA-like mRNA interferase family)